MTSAISYTLALALASGVVPLAGVSSAAGTLPNRVVGYIGPVASVPIRVYVIYLPVIWLDYRSP